VKDYILTAIVLCGIYHSPSISIRERSAIRNIWVMIFWGLIACDLMGWFE
jgi:hypothetical protein